MLAGRLLAGLRPHLPHARFHGIGGPRMMEQGFVSDVPMDTLTVRGLFEIIPRYREIKAIQNTLRDRLIADKPEVFIGADSPLKADGSAEFTHDVQLPRMLHGKVLRSAHPHAVVRRARSTSTMPPRRRPPPSPMAATSRKWKSIPRPAS